MGEASLLPLPLGSLHDYVSRTRTGDCCTALSVAGVPAQAAEGVDHVRRKASAEWT